METRGWRGGGKENSRDREGEREDRKEGEQEGGIKEKEHKRENGTKKLRDKLKRKRKSEERKEEIIKKLKKIGPEGGTKVKLEARSRRRSQRSPVFRGMRIEPQSTALRSRGAGLTKAEKAKDWDNGIITSRGQGEGKGKGRWVVDGWEEREGGGVGGGEEQGERVRGMQRKEVRGRRKGRPG